MSTHNICFYGELTKLILQTIIIKYPPYLFFYCSKKYAKQHTLKILIFAANNFHVLKMECHFAATNFRAYLVCLINFNGCSKFFAVIYFAEVSASGISLI